MTKILRIALMSATMMAAPALAQTTNTQHMDHSHMGHEMSAPEMPSMQHGSMPAFAEGSGTARLPGNEGAMHGIHISAGDWMVMAHGAVSTQYTNHDGPRGDDKIYATSMAMLSASKESNWGRIQLRSMFSLEPLMRNRGYPNLFFQWRDSGRRTLSGSSAPP